MNDGSLELVPTDDGTFTLMDAETGELYHNSAGAYTEALHNYFRPSAALQTLSRNGSITLLDSCFGLGYNTLVTLEELFREPDSEGTIHVVGIETDARVVSLVAKVLMHERFSTLRSVFDRAAVSPCLFSTFTCRHNRLSLTLELQQADLRQALRVLAGQENRQFDLVFHDPFSPRKVPELWTVDVFRLYRSLLDGRQGRILTYSTAAAVKGGLYDAGFHLYRTTAVGRKKGGTLGSVVPLVNLQSDVFTLSEAEVAKLSSGRCIPYRDFNFADSRELIYQRRLAEQESLE